MAGVLNHLDPARLEATLVFAAAARDRVASMIRSADIRGLVLPAGFVDALEMLRAARFDLVYFWEIGTDATNYFLPLARVAPLQVSSWGWPVTSGLPTVDYFLSSDQLEPVGAEAHYSEKLARLRRLPLSYARPERSAVESQRERFGFSSDEHIYLCVQNPRKFHPDFDPLIREILQSDPHGRFVLVEATPPFLTEQLHERFARTLGDVGRRVRFLPRMTKGEFHELIASADVLLDTPHYGGGANTTFETLALGKPLVTLAGQFHRSRFAAGVLSRIGLDDFVTTSPEAYVRLAVALGGDAAWREQLAHRITRSAAVLFEDRAAVGEIEDWFLSVIAQSRRRGVIKARKTSAGRLVFQLRSAKFGGSSFTPGGPCHVRTSFVVRRAVGRFRPGGAGQRRSPAVSAGGRRAGQAAGSARSAAVPLDPQVRLVEPAEQGLVVERLTHRQRAQSEWPNRARADSDRAARR